ncbi:MAG: PRC-barrel domain-containing protein [Nitrososphaerales archaeon]
MSKQLEKKTLKGSGGHIIANLTQKEIKKALLGGPELFLGAVGRIDKDRIERYYCKKCNKDYEGAPEINYEKVNEEVAKGYTLSEQGEFLCKQCGSLIAQYKKFAQNGETESASTIESETSNQYVQEGFVAIRKLIGMSVYDSDAMLVGTVKEIGLRDNRSKIVMAISTTEQSEMEVLWDQIARIGDVVLLKISTGVKTSLGINSANKCNKCEFENKQDSKFCEQCGNKLI